MDTMINLRAASRRHRIAERRVEQTRAELHRLVLEARRQEPQPSLRAVGEASGLSFARIAQIEKGQ